MCTDEGGIDEVGFHGFLVSDWFLQGDVDNTFPTKSSEVIQW